MTDEEEWLLRLLRLVAAIVEPAEVERVIRGLPMPTQRRLWSEWVWQAHEGQKLPEPYQEGAWRVWLMMAGRGFGKTRAGAEWVWARAREGADTRIALVGANMDDVVKIMIEGESGLQAAARADEGVTWRPSRSRVDFSTGASGFAYSGGRPAKLRGPQHHHAWCDEIAKWKHGEEAWDNLMLGLRLGTMPQVMVTTTPKPMPLLKRIMTMDRARVTGGATSLNTHLPDDFVARVMGLYEGTRLGRQELDGQLIEDVEGALWSRALIERSREREPVPRDTVGRVVIGVDPPAGTMMGTGASGAACGIVVTGRREGIGYVLADESVVGLSPEGWAAAVARAARSWRADRVVAEVNQGGRMVDSVLRAVEPHLPIHSVHASEGKVKRAEPVAALFERGTARLAGCFPELEDELAGLVRGGGYEGPGRSPDRADAMVWALTELMLGRGGAPGVRPL